MLGSSHRHLPHSPRNREETPRETICHRKARVAGFIEALFKFYADLNFTYLEINPVAVTEDAVIPLDLAAKLDSTAEFESGEKWGKIEFPAPFGRTSTRRGSFY